MSKPMMTLQELREAMQNQSSEGGSSRFLPMSDTVLPPGEHIKVRFVADADKSNPVGFFRDVWKHQLVINGRRESIICPRTIGDNNCPLCEASRTFYASDDKVNGKKFWARRSQIMQLIVRGGSIDTSNMRNTVYWLDAGQQISGKIKTACDNELEYVPFCTENGTDFNIRKELNGQNNHYNNSSFDRRESPLTEEEIQLIAEQSVDLNSIYKDRVKPHSELQAILEAQLMGPSAYTDSNSQAPTDTASMRERFAQRAKDYDEDLPDTHNVPRAETPASNPQPVEAEPVVSAEASTPRDISAILAKVRGQGA